MFDPNHRYNFVIYFYGDQEYINKDTGEIERKGNAYRGTPYAGKCLKTAFKFIRAILKSERKVLSSSYEIQHQIPQKLKIYDNGTCILTIPEEEGQVITDRNKNPQLLVNALNEFERFTLRFMKNNGNVMPIKNPIVPTITNENKKQLLNNERNSVFMKLNDYCVHKLGYALTKSNTFHLYEKIVAQIRIRIKDIPSIYDELTPLIDAELVETPTFEPLVPVEADSNDPQPIEVINTAFKKTPKATTNTSTDLSVFIDAAIDTLISAYEKTDRKATEAVKTTFQNAFSHCKDVSKIDAVFTNFQYQIEKGEF